MRHLFIMGTILDDLTKCTNTIRGTSESGIMLMVFIVFVLISSFTMLNMLIGILCEVVQATAEAERLKSSTARIREAISSLFLKLDEDESGTISRDEFLNMSGDREVIGALSTLKVKPKHFGRYAEIMFNDTDDGSEEGGSMSLASVCDLIMQLRPGAKVCALDFAEFKRLVDKSDFQIRRAIIRVDRLMTALLKEEAQEAGNWQADEPPKKMTVKDLEKVPDHEIISEICRRLGMTSMAPQTVELQATAKYHSTAKMVEAFESLGVPYFDSDGGDAFGKTWSREIHSC